MIVTKINTSSLGAYKQSLMGLASIGILLCHAIVYNCELIPPLKSLLNFGNLGVDIFYLLSGYGMFYSTHSQSYNILQWIRKRTTRILLPYFVISPCFFLIYVLQRDGSILDFLYHVSSLSYFKEHIGLWFVPSIILLYCITPAFKFIFDYCKIDKLKILLTLGLVLIITLIGTLDKDIVMRESNVFSNILFLIKRTPSYFVGFLLADIASKGKSLPIISITILPVVVHVLLSIVLQYKFAYWWIYSAPVAYLFVLVIKSLGVKVIKFMDGFGKISLESYITNWGFILILPPPYTGSKWELYQLRSNYILWPRNCNFI